MSLYADQAKRRNCIRSIKQWAATMQGLWRLDVHVTQWVRTERVSVRTVQCSARVRQCNLTPPHRTVCLQCAGFVETRPFISNEVACQFFWPFTRVINFSWIVTAGTGGRLIEVLVYIWQDATETQKLTSLFFASFLSYLGKRWERMLPQQLAMWTKGPSLPRLKPADTDNIMPMDLTISVHLPR